MTGLRSRYTINEYGERVLLRSAPPPPTAARSRPAPASRQTPPPPAPPPPTAARSTPSAGSRQTPPSPAPASSTPTGTWTPLWLVLTGLLGRCALAARRNGALRPADPLRMTVRDRWLLALSGGAGLCGVIALVWMLATALSGCAIGVAMIALPT